ncbi:MAG: SH3 domain-containing protein [Lachnospiraceae bacterium]|nr:SH3 domain-containing protein [Lachnospiraceae bacterium]
MRKKKNDINSWRNNKKDFFAILGDNKKFLMPVILVLAVALTVGIALSANHRAAEMAKAPSDADAAATYEAVNVPMEENAYPEVNALIDTYYKALADGDADVLKSIYIGLDETEVLKAVAASEYIEQYENITVYTKPGPVEGSYIAYIYNEVKLYDYEKAVPGFDTCYVCTNEDGTLFINGDVADANEIEYIKNMDVQGDVIDLNNKVASSYNEMVNADEKLAELLTKMRSDIQVAVGEALASSESSASADAATTEISEEEEEPEETETTTTIHTIRATDVVNIRSSDSETADILDKTTIDQEFTQLEALANGWSKIEYNGGVANDKTEFFEVVGEEVVEAEAESESETSTDTETVAETSSKVTTADTGKMTVTDSVRLRKSQSTDADIITMIYAGSTVNVVEQYANGWAKVEYNGSTGYIKSEFLKK